MNCKQCNRPLEEKRPDSIYCNHNCQQKYFKRKQLILSRIRKAEDELALLREIIPAKAKAILITKQKQSSIQSQLNTALEELPKKKTSYDKYQKVLTSTRAKFQQMLFCTLIQNRETKYNDAWIVENAPEDHDRLVDEYLERYKNTWPLVEKVYTDLTSMIKKLTEELAEHTETILSLQSEIDNAKAEIAELEPQLKALKETDLDRLPVQMIVVPLNGKPKYRPQVRSYNGNEILKMEFDTLELGGELGRFLGKLQRERCAIALTGDSGAGKSTFSYQLAKAFLKQSLNVAYFALETGFTDSVKQQIENHKINQYKFEAFSEGTLEDVRLTAPHFDCIIIDSYSKISTKPEDFEALRQDFPKTFFIVIFQKTTDGKIRGGSSILFNSTATIDIRLTKGGQRIAFMQKSRYETENFIYSINNDKLLKEDKLPVDWSEIESI